MFSGVNQEGQQTRQRAHSLTAHLARFTTRLTPRLNAPGRHGVSSSGAQVLEQRIGTDKRLALASFQLGRGLAVRAIGD